MKTNLLIATCLTTLCLFSCGSDSSERRVKIAATAVPHAEILEEVKPLLKKEGIDLDVIVIDDYNTPNRALADKEVDANYFQHPPFLDMQKKDFGYPLEILAAIHLEPMGLYSHKIKSLKDLKDEARVAVPSDPSNQARALLLMQKEGLITLKKQDVHTSIHDIDGNPHKLKFIEIDSPLLARALADVDLAAITTNFALQAKLSPEKDALAMEDAQSNYVNVLVIRKGEEGRPDLDALKKALQSPEVKSFIEQHYDGAIIPISQ